MFIETGILRAAIINGCRFAYDNIAGTNRITIGSAIVAVDNAVARAASLGLLDEAEYAETKAFELKRQADEAARQKALADEEARLKAELAEIDAADRD